MAVGGIFRFIFRGKRALVTGPLVVLLLVSGFLAARWRWYYGYSRGSRTGIVRKLSVKGPPYCKYVSAELIQQGTTALQQGGTVQQLGVGEVWEFTVDEKGVNGPLYRQLEQAEREGKVVTVHYRQDFQNKGKFWLMCDVPEHFAERID